MKKRTSRKRKPTVRKPTRRLTAQERWLRTYHRGRRRWEVTLAAAPDGRERVKQLFAFPTRLADLQKSDGVDPTRVEQILVSPFKALSAPRKLDQVRLRLAHYRAILDTLNIELDKREHREVTARITQLEQKEARLQQETQAVVPPGKGRQRPRWTVPPSEEGFWAKAPAEIPDDDPWLNPYRWPWLRERVAKLAEYLMTTRLVDPKDRLRTGRAHGKYSKRVRDITAELIVLFYRFYFRRLVFPANDVRVASNTADARARAARTTSR